MPRAAAEQALRDLTVQSPTAVGVVAAWPYRLHVQPQKENDDGQSQ
jgi:methylthioribose-1-phosphate isomerase